MEWIIRFIAIWAIFFLLVDWKELKTNIWCGVASIILQITIDSIYISNGYYRIDDPVISVWGSSIFFIFGPAFVPAILLAQFQPHKRWLQIIYVLIFATVYDIEEFLLLLREELVYLNWTYITSVANNLLYMVVLSWFSIVVLKRGVNKT